MALSYLKRLLLVVFFGFITMVIAMLSSLIYVGTTKPIHKITTRNDIAFIPWSFIKTGWLNYTLIIRSQVSIGQRNQTSIQNYPAPDLLSFDFGENALPNRSVDQFDINNSTLTTYGPLNQGQVRYPFVYQTRINNNDYGILVQEWTSKISRARFLFYIFPLDPAETFGLSNYINSLLNSGSGLVPVISYSDNNLCLSDTNSDKTYCSWYESQHTKTLKLAQKWKRNGFIPFEMGKYLFRMQTINY